MFSTNISSLWLHNSFIIFINTVADIDRPLTGHRPVAVREHARSMRRPISTPSTSNRPSTSATSWEAIHPATPSVHDTHGNNYTELCMYNFMLHLPHKYFCLFITVAIHLYHDIVKKKQEFPVMLWDRDGPFGTFPIHKSTSQHNVVRKIPLQIRP